MKVQKPFRPLKGSIGALPVQEQAARRGRGSTDCPPATKTNRVWETNVRKEQIEF